MKRICSAGSSRKAPVNCVVTVLAPCALHAAQRHALMLGLDHHGDAARLQRLVDCGDDVAGQPLLRLQAAGEDLDDAGELRQADDLVVGRVVGDVRLADERHHVVLAVGVERDVADEDHVVVGADVLEGAVERLVRRPGRSRRRTPRRRWSRGAACPSAPRAPGSSPAQAISVRTAASASSRLGRWLAPPLATRLGRLLENGIHLALPAATSARSS